MEYRGTFSPYDICSVEKSKQRNHPKHTDHGVHAPSTLVFADLIGLISPPTIGGHKCVRKFTDEFTKWKEVYLITWKSQAVERLFVQSLAIPMGFRLQRFRSDRGTEYQAGYFQKYRFNTGNRQEFTSTNIPQQNRVSERDGRTLTDMARFYSRKMGFRNLSRGKCSPERHTHTHRHRHRHTDTQTDTQTDRETDRQTDRQTNRQTDRQINRQTHRQTDKQTDILIK